jgi:hypothetical protein
VHDPTHFEPVNTADLELDGFANEVTHDIVAHVNTNCVAHFVADRVAHNRKIYYCYLNVVFVR